MRIIIYIDDILVMAPSKELAQEHTECLMFLLANLGFTVTRQKSLTDPTQEIDSLGLVADFVVMELRLPGSKIKNIRSDAKALLQLVQPTARQVSRLLGKLTHATHAMRATVLHSGTLSIQRKVTKFSRFLCLVFRAEFEHFLSAFWLSFFLLCN